MHVAINRHRPANLAVTLHASDGDGHVVNHAEALAVIGERVMESSANADCHTVAESIIGGQNGAARGQPEGLYQGGRKGDFEFHLLAWSERAGLQFLDILRSVDEQDILIGCRMRSDKIGRLGNSGPEQPVMNALVFFRGKNMGADGQVIVVAVDKLEGQHSGLSIQHSVWRALKTPYDTRLPRIFTTEGTGEHRRKHAFGNRRVFELKKKSTVFLGALCG